MPAERGQDVSKKIKNRLDTQRWYDYLWIGERHHDTERTVSEIHTFLPGITGSALSQHLAQMKLGGILEAEKRGMHVFYRIADPRVEGLLEVLKEYYCI